MSEFITPKNERNIEVGVYEHYKGNRYEVIGVARNSETNEDYVVYKPLYEHENQPDIWVRPYNMFIENVVVNGLEKPRFYRIDSGV